MLINEGRRGKLHHFPLNLPMKILTLVKCSDFVIEIEIEIVLAKAVYHFWAFKHTESFLKNPKVGEIRNKSCVGLIYRLLFFVA